MFFEKWEIYSIISECFINLMNQKNCFIHEIYFDYRRARFSSLYISFKIGMGFMLGFLALFIVFFK